MKDIDKGWGWIMKEVKELESANVDVGIQSNSGNYTNGKSIAEIGAIQEFGNGKIPSRPWMRQTFDAGGSSEISSFITSVFNKLLSKNVSASQMLKLVGHKYESMTKKKLTSGPWKANAPSTVKKKGSSRPLIDTGRLRGSIKYVIKKR